MFVLLMSALHFFTEIRGQSVKNDAFDFLLSQRDPVTFGWPHEQTPAAILGLRSAKPIWNNNADSGVSFKQLELEVLDKILEDPGLKKMNTANLALMVGSLQVACYDITDFHGHNLIDSIHSRLDSTPSNSPAFSSLALILCNEGRKISVEDVRRLGNNYQIGRSCPFCVETSALNIQALTCIGKSNHYAKKKPFNRLVNRLKQKNRRFIDSVQDTETGGFDSLIATSLAIQAIHLTSSGRRSPQLRKADQDQMDKARNHLLKRRRTDGSFSGSILITAMAIPAFSLNTAVTGGSKVNCPVIKTDKLNDGKIEINEKVYTQQSISGSFRVQSGKSLLDALNEFSKTNPDIFKFEISNSPLGSRITAINDLANDVDARTFWKVTAVRNDEEEIRINQGLEKIVINEHVVYVFTYNHV